MRSRLASLLLTAAFAIAVLAVPGSASAHHSPPRPPKCPPGQTGTPPYCVKPPPPSCKPGQVGKYPHCITPKILAVVIEANANGVTVGFAVNAPGTVGVSGSGVEPKSVKTGAGLGKITVPLTAQSKQTLEKTGQVTLNLTVTYEPTGAPTQKHSFTVVVKKPKKPSYSPSDGSHHGPSHGPSHGHRH
jgi:hypothetical protein